jgi:hypothetical protein
MLQEMPKNISQHIQNSTREKRTKTLSWHTPVLVLNFTYCVVVFLVPVALWHKKLTLCNWWLQGNNLHLYQVPKTYNNLWYLPSYSTRAVYLWLLLTTFTTMLSNTVQTVMWDCIFGAVWLILKNLPFLKGFGVEHYSKWATHTCYCSHLFIKWWDIIVLTFF